MAEEQRTRPTVRNSEDDQLNDHRQQPPTLPRADPNPRPRRGTLASTYDGQVPDLLTVNDRLRGTNEQAIAEDEGPLSPMSPLTPMTPREGRAVFGRTSPVVARRSYTRRQRPNLSRGSTPSRGQSPSPSNSARAFAEGRRRRNRAGTSTSKAASSVDLPLKRPGSRNSQSRSRRATFSARDEQSVRSSIEADVCYPGSESSGEDNESIDYSDLEDLVEMQEKEAERARDGDAQEADANAPRINLQAATPNGRNQTPVSDEDFEELEKHKLSSRRPSGPSAPSLSGRPQPKRAWTFFQSNLEEVIHAGTVGGLLEEGETFQNLFELPDGDEGCWWLDALNATEDEVTALCKAFNIHSLTREDIILQDEREKIELFKNYYFISFRSFIQDPASEDYLEPISHYAVVFQQGILTFTTHQGPHSKNIRSRMARLRDYLNLNADWICYALIDDIVDSFQPLIRSIEVETDVIEENIFTARDEDARPMLQRISEVRKKAMSLLRLLQTKPDVIRGFAKRCNEGTGPLSSTNVGMYLSDIQDHVLTFRDNLTHSEQLLSRLHNNFLAQLNVEHIASGNKINRLLGKVTVVATILVPLNVITGMFGMNVNVPGQNSNNLGWWFGILGVILLFIGVSLLIARRMRLF